MALLTRNRSWLAVITIVVCTAWRATANAQTPSSVEANIKAVFLFNFAKYVTWPTVGIGERSPTGIRICVTADDTFFTLLKSAVEGEDVDGKPLEPLALTGLDEARSCHILFVGDANSPDGKAWLTAVRGHQVLTVGNGPLNDETVIAFIREDNRIRFDINRAAAGRHQLAVSAKLLRLARQVRDR